MKLVIPILLLPLLSFGQLNLDVGGSVKALFEQQDHELTPHVEISVKLGIARNVYVEIGGYTQVVNDDLLIRETISAMLQISPNGYAVVRTQAILDEINSFTGIGAAQQGRNHRILMLAGFNANSKEVQVQLTATYRLPINIGGSRRLRGYDPKCYIF